MHKNRETTLRKFERTLRTGIARKLGRQVSAQRFADQFNLRANGTTTISRETARKWIRGEAIPEISRLKVLVNWLGLRTSVFLEEEDGDPSTIETVSGIDQDSAKVDIQKRLILLINDLDEKSIEALFVAAWALKEMRDSSSIDFENRKIFRLLK